MIVIFSLASYRVVAQISSLSVGVLAIGLADLQAAGKPRVTLICTILILHPNEIGDSISLAVGREFFPNVPINNRVIDCPSAV